jgi:hypothetical protein
MSDSTVIEELATGASAGAGAAAPKGMKPEVRRWSQDDEKRMLESITAGKSYDEIAVELHRTSRAVEQRLCLIAVRVMDAGSSLEQAVEMTHLGSERIRAFAAEHAAREAKKASKGEKKRRGAKGEVSEVPDALQAFMAATTKTLGEMHAMLGKLTGEVVVPAVAAPAAEEEKPVEAEAKPAKKAAPKKRKGESEEGGAGAAPATKRPRKAAAETPA